MNIIETLTAGFSSVARKPGLIIVPMLLNLFLWLGPTISVAPAVEDLFTGYRQVLQTPGDASPDAALTDLASESLNDLQTSISQKNLFSLLAWSTIGFPVIFGWQIAGPISGPVYEARSVGEMIGLTLAILAIGLAIACALLGMVGQTVRGERINVLHLLQRLPTYWLNLVLIIVPLGMAILVAGTMGMALGPFGFFVWVGLIWLLLLVSFVPEAITMTEASPLAALRDSLIVVRLNFWPTMGLIVLTNVIATGLSLVLQNVMVSSLGTLVAMLVYAFIGTGLLAAIFIFYRDRLALWHALLAKQRSESSNA
ncbi:MAG: hypothetical protein ACYC4R_13955 [Anaerolineae bacterium]